MDQLTFILPYCWSIVNRVSLSVRHWSALWCHHDSRTTIRWPSSDSRGQTRLYALHRRPETFPLWQTAPVLFGEWGPPLPSVNFSIRGDPLTQALFDHLLLRLEHQAPRPNLAPTLYRVTFEKRHCWSGWEAGWTRDRGCYFKGCLYTVGSCPKTTPLDPQPKLFLW